MPKIKNWERSAWRQGKGAAWTNEKTGDRIDIMEKRGRYKVELISLGGHPSANTLTSRHDSWDDAVDKARTVAKKHPNGI